MKRELPAPHPDAAAENDQSFAAHDRSVRPVDASGISPMLLPSAVLPPMTFDADAEGPVMIKGPGAPGAPTPIRFKPLQAIKDALTGRTRPPD